MTNDSGVTTGWENATLIARHDLTEHVAVLRVRADGDLFSFRAGQYAVIGMPASAPRSETADREDDDIRTVTRPEVQDHWQGHKGRVQSVFSDGTIETALGEPLSAERTHVFVSGNPEMVEDLQRILIKQGYKPHSARSPGTLHIERYW